MRLDPALGAHDHQPLDQVLQLAHVAGPRVPLEDLQHGGRELARPPVVGPCELLQKMMGQHRDVFGSLPQRGTATGITFRRKKRSSRKWPRAISSSSRLLVAAIIRTSTCTGRVEPTGSKRFSSSTRSTLAWVFRLMSPTSSKNSVPPSAF